jgi:hypothetical protein
MRKRQNILLVSVAAIALVAGTGLVSAQNGAKDQGAATQIKKATPSAAAVPQPMNGNKGASAAQGESKMGASAPSGKPSAQDAKDERGAGPSTAQKGPGENEPGASRGADEHKGSAAAQPQTPNRPTTATVNDRGQSDRKQTAEQKKADSFKGLHADTTKPMQGADVRLNEQQRTSIRTTVIEAQGAPRVDHVDFDVNVGTVVPRRDINVVPVPETLVRIEPQWSGFLYFVYEDEVIIVNPRDMRIVAVLTV